MPLARLIGQIPPPDEAAAERCRRHIAARGREAELGLLGQTARRLAALSGQDRPRLDRRCLLVFCAREGENRRARQRCTRQLRRLTEQGHALGALASHLGCAVQLVDLGPEAQEPRPGLLACRIRGGEESGEAACLAALRAGAGLARVRDAQVLILSALSDREERTARLALAALSEGGEPLARLAALESPLLAALCGAVLGAAACRTALLPDGPLAQAAALWAVALCPQAEAALLCPQAAATELEAQLQEALGLPPLHSLGLRQPGAGGLAALPLLDTALALTR